MPGARGYEGFFGFLERGFGYLTSAYSRSLDFHSQASPEHVAGFFADWRHSLAGGHCAQRAFAVRGRELHRRVNRSAAGHQFTGMVETQGKLDDILDNDK